MHLINHSIQAFIWVTASRLQVHSSVVDSVTDVGCCLLSSASPVALLLISPSVSTSPAACWPAHSCSSVTSAAVWTSASTATYWLNLSDVTSGGRSKPSTGISSTPTAISSSAAASFLMKRMDTDTNVLWLDADMCHSSSHLVTQLLIGGGTRAAWSKYMHAYSRSVQLLLVLITEVYSYCISLISIGTEQIPCI